MAGPDTTKTPDAPAPPSGAGAASAHPTTVDALPDDGLGHALLRADGRLATPNGRLAFQERAWAQCPDAAVLQGEVGDHDAGTAGVRRKAEGGGVREGSHRAHRASPLVGRRVIEHGVQVYAAGKLKPSARAVAKTGNSPAFPRIVPVGQVAEEAAHQA